MTDEEMDQLITMVRMLPGLVQDRGNIRLDLVGNDTEMLLLGADSYDMYIWAESPVTAGRYVAGNLDWVPARYFTLNDAWQEVLREYNACRGESDG